MIVRISSLKAEEVMNLLREADETSYSHTGSHDDTNCVLTVNGQHRAVRTEQYVRLSMGDSSHWEKSVDPGSLPALEGIRCATIYESSACYGSSRRSRARLRVLGRNDSRHPNFFVFDLGEVGGKDSATAPFHAEDIFGALLQAQKAIKIEVDGLTVTGDALKQFGFSRNEKYDSGRYWKQPPLTTETAPVFFRVAFERTMEFIAASNQLATTFFDFRGLERFNGPGSHELTAEMRAVKVLWRRTLLADFLYHLGIS